MPTDIVIRAAEGCDPDPSLLWDSVWQPREGGADWRIASGEPLNAGGLQASAALATAVTLALFTDRRVDQTHPLAWLADGDPGGWWGDAVDIRDDLGEAPLGSLLWLLKRAPLTIDGLSVARWAEFIAIDALKPLQDQGAVVRIEAQATANELRGRLDLAVQLYGRDGARIYDAKYDLIWRQIAG